MDYLNQCKKMHYLSELLKDGYNGTCQELANEIGISKSSLFRYIDDLKDYGAEVIFKKEESVYMITNDFNFLALLT